MSLSITSGSVSIPVVNSAGKSKAEKAAQDFEAVLLGSLLENLHKTFAGTSEEGPAGSSSYAGWARKRWRQRCPLMAASESRASFCSSGGNRKYPR